MLSAGSAPEYIISGGLAPADLTVLQEPFLLFLSVCISSYAIQARLYWKLWAWTDILPFKIKFDFSRCSFRKQINNTSLKQGPSPSPLRNIISLWCVRLRVPCFGDVTENNAAKTRAGLLKRSGCAAGHEEEVAACAAGPCKVIRGAHGWSFGGNIILIPGG